jgi:hypothetical protein
VLAISSLAENTQVHFTKPIALPVVGEGLVREQNGPPGMGSTNAFEHEENKGGEGRTRLECETGPDVGGPGSWSVVCCHVRQCCG